MKKLLKNKRGISLESVTIMIIVFSFVMIAGWSFYANTVTSYDVEVNESFSDPFNESLTATNALGTRVAEDISNPEATVADSVFTFVGVGISAIQIMFGSLNIITTLTGIVATTLGIPDIIVTTFLALVLLSIVFAIVRALLNTGET